MMILNVDFLEKFLQMNTMDISLKWKKRMRMMIEVEWVVFFLLGAMASYMGFLMGKGS